MLLSEKTVKRDVVLDGVGLHTGKKAKIILKASCPGSGVTFRRAGRMLKEDKLSVQRSGLSESDLKRRSVVGDGEGMIETVEHLSASISALGITNLLIEVEGPEIPAMDGSAYPFAEAILRAGIVDQGGAREVFAVSKPLWVSEKESAIIAMPYDGFRVTYTMDYRHPLLSCQTVSFDITEEIFLREVAPSRTFCREEEALELRRQGFGKGADCSNTLVMGPDGPKENKLRFADECARHKVLDIVGDLGLGGFWVRAHVIGIRSGHQINQGLLELMINERKNKE